MSLLCIIVGLAFKGTLYQPQVAQAANVCSETDCLRILNSIQSLKTFPLPYPIDEKAYGDILEEIGHPELVTRLLHSRSDANALLAATAKKLVRFITRATQVYTRSTSEYTNHDFHGDIQIMRQQIREAKSHIRGFLDLYGTVRDDYYTFDAITAKELHDGQLSDAQEWWVCQRPPVSPRIGGFDANKKYLAPIEEKARRREKARLAVITWERDTQRLEQILRIIQEGERILQQLAGSLTQWETTYGPSSTTSWALQRSLGDLIKKKSEVRRDPRQRWLREWFEQLIANSGGKESWKELLMFMESSEQIKIEINIEWCQPL